MLTKDDMLVALHDAITEDQEFELADEIVDAMEAYPQPFDLVDPVLDFISKHPEVDFGAPGELVHFVERFYHQGYEELLMESVLKSPTVHNIWMLHRCSRISFMLCFLYSSNFSCEPAASIQRLIC